MGALIAFGLGVVVGGLAAFTGGRRYEAAAAASMVAAGYVSVARTRWRAAVRSVALAVVVVALGAVVILVGR
ncbi:hypothetical protein [Actinoplanes teichomyceticus]|uniref:Uncharacterized protein n=1 Tax=Actinoplanes teichomyceticus TaxID=1867 RepID=A0A561WAQ9_ACTTI|nr:hypothetical protein [Actinoplanes teichomyceticus]TWG20947.1 hypothetical protein FHX34_103476 [Actinoplanes teichomyceticus]GIF16533.1 hypothetical protein Ate01nite_65650 [Actinoplanes teichomyceticus]